MGTYRRIAVAAVAAVVAWAGAGCQQRDEAAAPSPTAAAPAREALAASTAKTTSGPVRMRIDMQLATVTMTMTGSADLPAKKMAATVAMRGPERTDMEMRLDGERVYMRSPMAKGISGGKQWIALDMSAAAKVPGMEQLSDPDQALGTDFLNAVTTVERAGATEFRGTIDFTKTDNGEQWVKSMPGVSKKLTAVPFTATVDGEGRLQTVAITEPSVPLRMTATYSEFGVPVTVTAPPATQTHDLTKKTTKA